MENKAKTIVRVSLEAALGGIVGWYLTDNLISPNFDSGENITTAMYNYMKQYEYNTFGAAAGALMFPLANTLRRLYTPRENQLQE